MTNLDSDGAFEVTCNGPKQVVVVEFTPADGEGESNWSPERLAEIAANDR